VSRSIREQFVKLVVIVDSDQKCPLESSSGYRSQMGCLDVRHDLMLVCFLMGTRRLEWTIVPSDHHTTERQRGNPARHEREMRQEPCQRWSVRLEDAINNAQLRTPETRQHDHKAEGGCRRRPRVTE
jgi:hypothetical protein